MSARVVHGLLFTDNAEFPVDEKLKPMHFKELLFLIVSKVVDDAWERVAILLIGQKKSSQWMLHDVPLPDGKSASTYTQLKRLFNAAPYRAAPSAGDGRKLVDIVCKDEFGTQVLTFYKDILDLDIKKVKGLDIRDMSSQFSELASLSDKKRAWNRIKTLEFRAIDDMVESSSHFMLEKGPLLGRSIAARQLGYVKSIMKRSAPVAGIEEAASGRGAAGGRAESGDDASDDDGSGGRGGAGRGGEPSASRGSSSRRESSVAGRAQQMPEAGAGAGVSRIEEVVRASMYVAARAHMCMEFNPLKEKNNSSGPGISFAVKAAR
jgi:hypothetical protein